MKYIIAIILTIIGAAALGTDAEIGTFEWLISVVISQLIIIPSILWWDDYLKNKKY